MARSQKHTDPILTVKLSGGLADRNRLPLAHVLRVLDEVREMMVDVGRDIQRQHGFSKPTGDFGLEIVADAKGLVFGKGSVEAPIAITSDVRNGILAAREILQTVHRLSTDQLAAPTMPDGFNPKIVRRLNRLAKIQETDKTQLQVIIIDHTRKKAKPVDATFGATAIAAARALEAPEFEAEAITLYGKLYQLRDRVDDDDEGKGFWGELRRENGELWRVQFKPEFESKAAPLFRKQVIVTGRAVYFRVRTPKIVVTDIDMDRERDYESAFDDLFGCNRDLYNADLPALLKELHGE